MKSCAAADIVKAAAKTTTIVTRITSPAQRLGAAQFAFKQAMNLFASSYRSGCGAAMLGPVTVIIQQ